VQDEEADVKKMIGIAVAFLVVLAVLRRFGPALRDRAMAKCQEMFERSSGGRALGRALADVATGG
jgi:hypothetical protein